MSIEKQLEILGRGVQAWNRWRKKNPKAKIDLRGADLTRFKNLREVYFNSADLSGVKLRGVNLSEANLVHSNLRKAELQGAMLSGTLMNNADLRRANLSGADLWGTHFIYADLEHSILKRADFAGVDLRGANLRSADFRNTKLASVNFSGADLRDADFSSSHMQSTIFTNVDLSTAKGLQSVFHAIPSSIGVDTIYLSKGEISEKFLRGVGIPETFISHMHSLLGKPYEFYSCFISYSSKDQEFVERLHADLQQKGVRCWFAPEDVRGGRKLLDQIDQAIRLHERVLLVLSHESMKSEWVKTEIARARKREIEEKRQILFPIRLVEFEVLRNWECFDSDTGKDSAREIREYFVPDFRDWRNYKSYQDAFKRLLSDLQTK